MALIAIIHGNSINNNKVNMSNIKVYRLKLIISTQSSYTFMWYIIHKSQFRNRDMVSLYLWMII